MNAMELVIATLIILPAIGLSIWIASSIADVMRSLRGFDSLEGMHFETCAPSSTALHID